MRSRALITIAYFGVLPILGLSTIGCFHNVYLPPPVGGNWIATVSSSGGQNVSLKGALALSGLFDSITGVAHISGLPCVSADTPLETSGKQDMQTLQTKLSINLDANNRMDIVGTQSENLSALSGTFTMKNSSCNGITSGHITATQFAPLSGTYTGSLSLSQGGALEISTSLTQDKLANEEGKYPVSGSATITPSQCASGWTLANSFAAGDQFVITYVSADSSSQLQASGKFSQDAKSMNVTSFIISGGSCDNYSGAGTLVKQPLGQ